MAKDKELWSSVVDHVEEIHAELPPAKQAAAALPSSPLRAAARPFSSELAQLHQQWQQEHGGGGRGGEGANEIGWSSGSETDSFICNSPVTSVADSGGGDSEEEAQDAQGDSEEAELQRARASAMQEHHTPRAKSTRTTRQPERLVFKKN